MSARGGCARRECQSVARGAPADCPSSQRDCSCELAQSHSALATTPIPSDHMLNGETPTDGDDDADADADFMRLSWMLLLSKKSTRLSVSFGWARLLKSLPPHLSLDLSRPFPTLCSSRDCGVLLPCSYTLRGYARQTVQRLKAVAGNHCRHQTLPSLQNHPYSHSRRPGVTLTVPRHPKAIGTK